MLCNNCSQEQLSGAKFCSNCGAKNINSHNNIKTNKKWDRTGKFAKYWKYIVIILVVVPLAFNFAMRDTKISSIKQGQYYTIKEDGSKIKFLSKPVRSERTVTMENNGLNKLVIYAAQDMGNVYLFTIGQYDDKNFDTNFSVETLEQNFQNVIANSNPNSKLISKEKIIFHNKQAIQYIIDSDDGYLQGITFLSGRNAYALIGESSLLKG